MTNPTDGRVTSLATAASLSAADLFMVVSPGNAATGVNFKLPYSLLATSIASTILPSNGATGSIYFGQGLSSAPSFIPVSGDVSFTNNTAIATATITTHAVTFAKIQQVAGLSVPGIAGTATADLAAITGTTDQVLRVASNGTSLGFGAINLTAAALTGVMPVPFGGTGTSTLTQAGVIFGNGTSIVGITAAGGTALPLVATGGTAAPTFSVLTVPGGGTGTSTLALNRVLVGNGTSTIASTNIATTGFPLVGNGTLAAPGFAVLGVPGGGTNTTTLTAFGVVYGNGTSTVGITAAGGTGLPLVGTGPAAAPSFAILGVPGGGTGTGTTTPFTLLTGGTTATSQVQSLGTTGATGLVLTSQGAGVLPIWSAAGAGTVTQVTGAGLATGTVTTSSSITVLGASTSQMQTGTATTVAVTPAVQQWHQSAAKAWVLFAPGVATCSLIASFNVTNVSYLATGQYAVNFTVPFAGTNNYMGIAMAQNGAANAYALEDAGRSGSKFPVIVVGRAAGAATDVTGVNVVCFGTE